MNAEYVICFKNRLRHLGDLGFKSHEERAPRGLVARKVDLCPGDTAGSFFSLYYQFTTLSLKSFY